jgi:hypothetical protein
VSTIPTVGPDGLGHVFDRISALAPNRAFGPTFDQLLDAAAGNRTGPVLDLQDTIETKSRAIPSTSSAWPSIQTASTGMTLGGYLGLDGTGTPATDAWMAGLPDAAAPWVGAITDAARRNDVDPRLLAALVWSESGFRADAVSGAGARGLAQLMPGTAAGMGLDPDDPLQNLEGGARYLRAGLDRFGTPELALAAYNAGPGNVERYGGVPPFDETQRYVSIVLDRYQQLGGQQ